MTAVQVVRDERAAVALAGLLNGDTRRRPVAVVTTPAGAAEPLIDVDALARETGDLADVYLMTTGSVTWAFSGAMSAGTQVYGGAGRVYPVGHRWASDLAESPLRFAYNAADGVRATQLLISDALRMANAAGLVHAAPRANRHEVRGHVKMIVAGRALVDVGEDGLASVAEELTVEGVPIDRLLTTGQSVTGWYDPVTRRLDVTGGLRHPAQALTAYAVGDVVLVRVRAVAADSAQFLLFPRTTEHEVTVSVARDAVTSNPSDDLRTLLTVGEVVAARVVRTGADWALALDDVDDDEPVRPSPSLLPGGPPWLTEDEPDLDEFAHLASPPAPAPLSVPAPPVAPAVPTPQSSPVPTPGNLGGRVRPAPTREPTPTPAPAGPPPSTQALLLKIDALNAEVGRLTVHEQELDMQARIIVAEREQLGRALMAAEARAARAENSAQTARARLRKAGTSRGQSESAEAPQFADPEQGFRHLVVGRWASRIPTSEQPRLPLPDYRIGPDFLASLAQLEGITAEKVADVVVEILTGRAVELAGREVHRLRTGPGGTDPIRTRDDGAVCWRASLQVKSPSARRIHYWILPSGQVELARVAVHDDFTA